jgi:outer membrane protein assembly factor BamB
LGGRGDITETHARWISQRNMPDVPGVLLYQGVLYLIKNGGILTTLNPEDGSLLWQGRVREALDNYYASPVAGDGKVYLASEKGLVTVLKPGPQPEPLATSDFGEAIFATPALADGRVYLRTSSKLYCFEIADPFGIIFRIRTNSQAVIRPGN